ncbi:MAG: LysR family transcriptional regulator [Clostridium sp.]
MNLKDITYFVEVVKRKNFTKAANDLHISQPALSKAIKILEHETKTQLIDRNTKKFKLTDEGEILFENAKTALEIINTEMYKLEDSLLSCKKTLTIGLPPVVGSVYFPSIIAEFREEYPDIDLKILEEGSNDIMRKVEDGTIEVGAIILPINSENLIPINITDGDVMLVVSKKHKLANRKTINVDELKNENFITFNENFMMYNKTINACIESGFEPNIIMKTSQWDFIIEMVGLNQGITIMPKPIVERFKTNDIKLIHIKKPEIHWDIGFIVKKDKYMSKTLKLFVEYATNHIRKEHEKHK